MISLIRSAYHTVDSIYNSVDKKIALLTYREPCWTKLEHKMSLLRNTTERMRQWCLQNDKEISGYASRERSGSLSRFLITLVTPLALTISQQLLTKKLQELEYSPALLNTVLITSLLPINAFCVWNTVVKTLQFYLDTEFNQDFAWSRHVVTDQFLADLEILNNKCKELDMPIAGDAGGGN